MMAKRLASRTHYVCATPDYLAVHGVPHTVLELEQHNCLLGTLGYWRFHERGKTRHIRVKGNIHCNSGWSLVDVARKSIGVIQLPDYYVQVDLKSGRLVSVLDAYGEPEDGIWAICPQKSAPFTLGALAAGPSGPGVRLK